MWWKETNLSPAFSSIKKFLRNWLSSSIYLLLNVSYNSLLEMQRILKISSFYSRCYLKSDEEMHRGEGEGEVKSARYRLRLRGAERGGTSTPSRIDRTVDASPFWRNTCWADSPPRPSLDGHFANDRGMCRGISVINYGRALAFIIFVSLRVKDWIFRSIRELIEQGWTSRMRNFLFSWKERNYSGFLLARRFNTCNSQQGEINIVAFGRVGE